MARLSLGIYDEKLYEKSLQELDFFSQKVNDSLQDVEKIGFFDLTMKDGHKFKISPSSRKTLQNAKNAVKE